ncbi:MAG: GAF domain-containing protein [Acidobacteria bacterium]|nr:GAF domain-containing protein [Acidobacteriota bacterium]
MTATTTAPLPGEPVEHTQAVDFLHEIGSRLAAAEALDGVLERIVDFLFDEIGPDSVFIYVLDDDELVLRASKNPHPEVLNRLKIRVGQGITGWVAEHRKPVAIARNVMKDPRFLAFTELPEDAYEAFLSVPLVSRGKLVGVINLQHRLPHMHTRREIALVTTIGFLVGSEIELARMEDRVSELHEQLETRKLVERAKGLLQRDMGLTEEEAYLTLQRQARQRRLTMKQVAEAIVLSDDVRRLQAQREEAG